MTITDLAAPDGSTSIKAVTTASFSPEVIAASQRLPVLVLFLSPRDERCRLLQASLAKAVKAADGKVKLVTMDMDAYPQIAERLGVRAVPAVYAFQKGQPIDGFMGPLPEAQIKGFIERLVGPIDDGFEDVLSEAEIALGNGDVQTAADLYTAVLEAEPEHLVATAGLIRTFVAAGDLEAARGVLAQVSPAVAKDKSIVAAQAAFDVAEQASSVGDLGPLLKALEADPDDHQARFDLALGLNGRGKREEAADALLTIMKRDRTWNETAARKQLLQFFEAWGLMDPVTLAARRKLSTLLFS